MLSPRCAPYLFALILSGMMSFMVSGIATYRAIGLIEGFIGVWLTSWTFCWMVACPVAILSAPIARRFVGKMVRAEA